MNETKENVNKQGARLMDKLRGDLRYQKNGVNTIAGVMLLYQLCGSDFKQFTYNKLLQVLPKTASGYVQQKISEQDFEQIKEASAQYSAPQEDLQQILFYYDRRELSDRNSTLSPAVNSLAAALLDIKDGDKAAHITTAGGGFVINNQENCPKADYKLYAKSMELVGLAQLQDYIADCLHAYNAFHGFLSLDHITQLCAEYNQGKIQKAEIFAEAFFAQELKANKLFLSYPFGMRVKDVVYDTVSKQDLLPLRDTVSAELLYAYWLHKHQLKEPGSKAVILGGYGHLCNSLDKEMRKYLVENHLVEAVILLPAELIGILGQGASMLVLSRGNNGIKLIDARQLGSKNGRKLEFTQQDVEAILQACQGESSLTTIITDENQLKDKQYSFESRGYFIVGEGISLWKLGVVERTPTMFSTKKDDGAISPVETPHKLMRLQDMQGGRIAKNLLSLKEYPERFKRYCLKEGDILMPRSNYADKIVVVKECYESLLAPSNVYFIRVDKERANPYYIKAFLESKQGQELLDSIATGGRLEVIGQRELRELRIPLPPIMVQNQIGDRYAQLIEKAEALEAELERTKKAMTAVLEGMD